MDFSMVNKSQSSINEYFHVIKGLEEKKKIKIVTREISINGVIIRLSDVKVFRFKEAFYKLQSYRRLVPRGLCFVFINDELVHVLYGHQKFGNYGEYIPDEIEDPNIFITKYYNRKENGECAHVSFFKYNNITYLLTGSKNVHLVARFEYAEIDLQMEEYKEPRYNYAIKIAKLFVENYKQQLNNALNYILDTCVTFCAESCFLDSQHLIEYKQNQFFFFGITSPASINARSECNITVIDPEKTIKLFNKFGLPTVTETLIGHTQEECKNIESKIELDENSEGCVVTTLFENGTTYVYKHKNFHYVFWRAVREQMKHNCTSDGLIERLNKLYIDHPDKVELTKEALQFNNYYYSLSDSLKFKFFENWVTRRNTFKKLSSEEKLNFKSYKPLIYDGQEKYENDLYVIMFVGMPGSGKSFCARALKYVLNKYNIVGDPESNKVVWLEQDMFASSGKGAAKAYDNAIAKAVKDKLTKVIILSKSNHTIQVRNKTYEIVNRSSKNIEYINVVFESSNLEHMRDVCVDRIMSRGDAHTTLFGKSKEEIHSILTNVFVKQWEPLDDDEENNETIPLNIESSKSSNLIILFHDLYASFIFENLKFDNDEPIKEVIRAIEEEDKAMILEKKSMAEITTKTILNKHLKQGNVETHNKKNVEIKEETKSNKKVKEMCVEYDALIVHNPEFFAETLYINPLICSALKQHSVIVKKDFHITLEYFGKKRETEVIQFQDGIEFEFIVIGFAIDADALALCVRIPDELKRENGNENPHITIALRTGVKAQYSNTLIKKAIVNKTLVIFDEPFKLFGSTKRFKRFM